MALRSRVLLLRMLVWRFPLTSPYKWIPRISPLLVTARNKLMFHGTLSGLFLVNALSFGFGDKSGNNTSKQQQRNSSLIERADRLYDERNIDELINLLVEYKDGSDAEILWRYARALCDKGKSIMDMKEKEKYFRDALKYAAQALCQDEDNFACHKWYAFMLNYLTPFVGIKESLQNAFQIKFHLRKALSLNPRDATTMHALGYWCYTFADLTWYETRLASVLFTTPPKSTFEEALEMFLQAEQMDPGFYSMNLLMIAKTYHKLRDVQLAYKYASMAARCAVVTEDDKVAVREADHLMKELRVKK